MNIDTLIRQLTMEIEQQLSSKVLDKRQFTLPYSTVEVSYLPILKKRMDILMKMLLTSFKTGSFSNIEQLASILMVEPLFINDLTKQMEHSHLVVFEENYQLTVKGEQQLKDGIYEEQMPTATTELFYSTLHAQFFNINPENLDLELDLPEPLSYFEDDTDIEFNEETVRQAIQQQLSDEESELIVQDIESINTVELYDFPYILFICYDEKNDRLYSRAYNIYTNEWDDAVSKFMDTKELVDWRQKYL